jgi:ABC-type amino acid transport substrate-binding protein
MLRKILLGLAVACALLAMISCEKKDLKIGKKEYDEIGLAIEDLANGRIAAVVCDTPVAAQYALQNPNYAGKLKIVGQPFTDENYGVAVKKGNSAVLDLLNDGLKKVIDSGEAKTLEDKWLKGVGTAAVTAVKQPAGARKIVVATDATWPPMEMVDENKNIVGFDIDLLTAAANAAGFVVEFKNTAWDGIFAGLEAGKYDAVISSVTITEERQKTMDFSTPYINAGQILVVKSDSTNVTTLADLKGKTVGAQIGTTGAFAIDKANGN